MEGVGDISVADCRNLGNHQQDDRSLSEMVLEKIGLLSPVHSGGTSPTELKIEWLLARDRAAEVMRLRPASGGFFFPEHALGHTVDERAGWQPVVTGTDGRSHFAGFLLRQQRIGTRGHLTCSRRTHKRLHARINHIAQRSHAHGDHRAGAPVGGVDLWREPPKAPS